MHHEKAHNPLHHNKIPNAPWEHISTNIIGELPESNGYNTILVIVDQFSKIVIVIPQTWNLLLMGLPTSIAIMYGVNMDFLKRS